MWLFTPRGVLQAPSADFEMMAQTMLNDELCALTKLPGSLGTQQTGSSKKVPLQPLTCDSASLAILGLRREICGQ